MKYYLKTIYPLMVIALFFGLTLSLAYKLLNPSIIAARKADEQSALQSVFPNGAEFVNMTNDGEAYYQVYNEYNETIGYIFKENEAGYGGPIVTLVGINLDAEVESIYILSADQETPGLGYKCMEKPWQEQFSGLSRLAVPQDKSGFESQDLSAITGATITSQAVADNIDEAFEQFNQVYTPQAETNTGGENGLE